MTKNQPLIELTGINKVYKSSGGVSTNAVNSINLTIMPGEFVSIMGASGSGKSTLMHIIGLLDQEFEGDYILEGGDITKVSDSKLAELRSSTIGFVFQHFNLLKRTSVLDNVLLPTTYKSGSDDTDRAIEALRRVGLEKYLYHHTNQLSGGQMQRVAIARALMMNPRILLADEPTGNLDSKTADEVMELFKEINREGTTIILITHENDIAAYADRKIELLDGRIKKETRK